MPTPVMPLKPPAAWLGGKRNLADRLVARIHAIPHEIYAEPFVGMGGVFFRRRVRPRVEIINDLSRDVSNFFRVLQRHERALVDELLGRSVASREEFERQMKVDPETLTDLERAARFYYLQRLVFSGKVTGRTFGVSPGVPSRFDIRARRLHLKQIHARLSGVLIECLPFDEFLERYDRPDILFYLDPPYFAGEEDYGKGMFRRSDYRRMADILRALKGRFLLSINDVPEVRKIFDGFHLEEIATTYTIGDVDRTAGAIAELIVGDGKGGEVGRQETLL